VSDFSFEVSIVSAVRVNTIVRPGAVRDYPHFRAGMRNVEALVRTIRLFQAA
jgi:hypothetical protein